MGSAIRARSVNWWTVHRFVVVFLDQCNEWPMAGTPAWCALAPDDPRKWAALLDAAQHHALRLELAQEAVAEAAKDISAMADWRSVAQEMTQRRAFRESHPWTRRKAS